MIILYSVLAIIALVIIVICINTIRCKKPELKDIVFSDYKLDTDKICGNLSDAIKYKTITAKYNADVDSDVFIGFHNFLEKTYPKLHSTLTKEVVNDYSLLYKWESSKASEKPIVLMAHMDVVPISQKTLDEWEYEPFSGHIDEEYVWGRGSLDMKGHLISICQSVEYLIENGFEPKRDIYIAFGHDEESIGKNGMGEIVKLFKQRKINPEYAFDEGGAVIDGKMLGADCKLGLVGICEKGYADIVLQATDKGGHSSQPPKYTSVSKIAEAIVMLKNNQLKATMNKPLKDFLTYVSPYMSTPMKILASNLWLFSGLMVWAFGRSATSGALTKTTFAPTMLSGSNATNVLAQRASVNINFRISPDDSVDKLVAHIEKVLKNTGVKIDSINAHDPSSVSDIKSKSFKMIEKTMNETIQGIVASPYLTIATTDSRMFSGIADNIYKFSPFRSIEHDLGTIHANNERLAKESLIEGVKFFIRLIENSNY